MTIISEPITDLAGVGDGTSVVFTVDVLRPDSSGTGVITTKRVPVYPVAGVLTTPDLDPGPAKVKLGTKTYPIVIPDSPTPIKLWPLLESQVEYPAPVVTAVAASATAAAASASAAAASAAEAASYSTGAPDATTASKGVIQLGGDLAGTAAAPTVPALAGKAALVHTHVAADITDLMETVQDAVGGMLVAGTGVTVAYNDAAGTVTLTATGGGGGLDAEAVRDTIAAALIGSGLVTVTANDAGDTITISTSATQNASDSALRDRSTHTGSQAMSTITGLGTALDAKVDDTDPRLSDATTTTKGIVQLAGDLAGTAAAPTVPGLANKAPTASPTFTGTLTTPALAVTGGTPAAGKVLTSDATGNATWSTPVGGPSSTALGNTVASQSVDVTGAAGKVIRATLAVATTTFAFTNLAAGARWTMQVTQDATGGRAAAWTGVTWVPNPPVLATAANAVNLMEFFSPDGSTIYGFLLNPTVGGASLPFPAPSTRLEPIPRILAGSASSLSKGQIWLQHFVPDRDFTVSNIVTHIAGTVGAGATLTRCGIYQYTAANSYTCIARSANTATRWNSTGEKVAAIADNGAASPGAISSIALKGGTEYAYALITVGNTTEPQLRATPVSDQGTLAPRMGAVAYTQTDLPATLSSITDQSWMLFWAGLT